ncbi:MAG: hypothetical protein NVV74_22345 [Magnetospirillum sp.]|nr:hypothetical protein [Magnetospirillum sp.]
MLPSAPLIHMVDTQHADLTEMLMSVVTDLTEVIEEENALMAEGMPAAVTATIDRKLELSDAYEDLYAELVENRRDCLTADPAFANRLMEAVLHLREVTTENMARLEAAMQASRRRVEAVMAAMRSTIAEDGPYSAKGEVPIGARLAAFGKDFHA